MLLLLRLSGNPSSVALDYAVAVYYERRTMTACQQGGKRLMSTLLLFFAAHVGLPPNNPWSPYTLAHQPSQSRAHTQQNGLNIPSMDELGYHRIFSHHDELWIYAAILAFLFSGGFLQ